MSSDRRARAEYFRSRKIFFRWRPGRRVATPAQVLRCGPVDLREIPSLSPGEGQQNLTVRKNFLVAGLPDDYVRATQAKLE